MAGVKKAVRKQVMENAIARAPATYVELTTAEATTLAAATSGDLAAALSGAVAQVVREVPFSVVVLKIG